MLGSLLASAASATPVDGGIWQHPKLDNTRYTYNDRSYGVRASVGLADGPITEDTLALSYMYQEDGLRADVACIYNTSTKFVIADESETHIYPIVGNLPDSGDSEEYSDYFGHSNDRYRGHRCHYQQRLHRAHTWHSGWQKLCHSECNPVHNHFHPQDLQCFCQSFGSFHKCHRHLEWCRLRCKQKSYPHTSPTIRAHHQ